MAIAITLNRLLCLGTGLLLIAGSYGCDELSRSQRKDDPTSSLNTKTSKWRGNSSDGSYSRVDQVSTGKNSFAFTEAWYKKGPKPIKTSGSGRFEASKSTNIYTYSTPPGVVVVRTKESADETSMVDTVVNTTIPLFKVGEQITYTVRK
ncbi:hypothetical protein KBY72_01735 [Cyanobium sp. BA5m-21]|uniref:hypothetical protein n=1 Tax=Cyanobium sp. BA5m-21 TaxID=2823706 RepID=UPI0020CF8C28|nr:hypothetical protein [Cyanobium sp. BA5m-21]MCP9905904.1 hypothetical protein [Cyanobium sp. BA5m-21]